MYRQYTVNAKSKIEAMDWQTTVTNELSLHCLIRCDSDVLKLYKLPCHGLATIINSTDADNNTPLHLAVERGYGDWVEFLLSHKADINVINAHGLTPLMMAVRHERPQLVFVLLSNGANVNATNKDGQTAMHYAASSGNTRSMEYLLQYKPKINQQDQNGVTPLILACKMRQRNIVILLLHHKSVARINANLADNFGRSPLHWAAEVGDAQIVQELINANAEIDTKDNDHETPFVRSIKQNRLEVLDVLILAGCDRNDIDGLNGTAMTMSCLLGRYRIIQKLLDIGEDVNEVGHIGMTPLSAAVFECHVKSVALLLENGADPNLMNRMGCNPLVEACKFLKDCRAAKRHEIAKMLLRSNADPNRRVFMAGYFTSCTNGRNCALSFAITTGYCSMVKLMLIGGAKVSPNEVLEWIKNNELENANENCMMLKRLYELVKEPVSLKVQSRRMIRKCLGFMIQKKIHLLPIPQVIQRYVDLEELDSVEVTKLPLINTELSGELPGLPCSLPCGLRTLQGTLSYELYGSDRLNH